MKRAVLIGLVAALVVAVAAPAVPAYQFKVGMRVKMDFYWTVRTGSALPAGGTMAPDLTTFVIGFQDDSYLRVDFTSDDKTTGARIELGMWDGAIAGGANVGLRHIYGWYKFGRCKLLIGHTETMFASGIGAPYAQLGWAAQNGANGYQFRIRNGFKNTGKLTSGRFSHVALYYTIGSWTFMGALGAVPVWPTEGATPTLNGNVIGNAMLPRLDVAVMYKSRFLTVVPGFSVYQYRFESWQNVIDAKDQTYTAWAFAVPFHVALGNFGFKGELSYAYNWATSNYEDYWHDGVYWGGANDRFPAGGALMRWKLAETRIIGAALGFYYKVGKATIWLSGGIIRADNGSSDANGTWRHGQNVRYGLSFAVPYQVNKHFTIAPEIAWYYFGNDPRFDLGTAGAIPANMGQVDLGQTWLIGMQFVFKF